MKKRTRRASVRLSQLGIYGYEKIEPVIFASLVTADPLLLIGHCGTGKTQLLNSLSETLGLEHRHYNASLISFDDLVGFPYPSEEFRRIEYLETPATVWQAESVLIDEISRCKPEHQNRLFSIVQERRIQGLPLEKLRYRWAAMNPFTRSQGGHDSYEGSEPLDQALADRFAFVVEVPDWGDLSEATHRLIARSNGFEPDARLANVLRERIAEWQEEFDRRIADPPEQTVEYARIAALELARTRFRLSPRRVRQLVRNITALTIVRGHASRETSYRLALQWSLPHRAWGSAPGEPAIRAAHRIAWDKAVAEGTERWLVEFHLEPSLARKAALLTSDCPDPDTGTVAVTQLLSSESPDRAAAFAYAVYPAALKGALKIGTEGITDIGKLATSVLDIEGEGKILKPEHRRRYPDDNGRLQSILDGLKGKRRERAAQLFNYLWISDQVPANPEALERELEECVKVLRRSEGR